MHHTVDQVCDYFGASNSELVAFAAHVLQQDSEMELTAARNAKHVGISCFLHAQRDIGVQLALQAPVELAAGNEAALLPREWRGIDLKRHGQRRFVDREHR